MLAPVAVSGASPEEALRALQAAKLAFLASRASERGIAIHLDRGAFQGADKLLNEGDVFRHELGRRHLKRGDAIEALVEDRRQGRVRDDGRQEGNEAPGRPTAHDVVLLTLQKTALD